MKKKQSLRPPDPPSPSREDHIRVCRTNIGRCQGCYAPEPYSLMLGSFEVRLCEDCIRYIARQIGAR